MHPQTPGIFKMPNRKKGENIFLILITCMQLETPIHVSLSLFIFF